MREPGCGNCGSPESKPMKIAVDGDGNQGCSRRVRMQLRQRKIWRTSGDQVLARFFFLATAVAMLGKKKDLDAGFALAYGDYSQR